jgi:hypothetical protein
MTKQIYTPSIAHHAIADCWPLLPYDKLETFANNLAGYGQKTPIVLYEGKVLDGRIRLYACDMKGIKPRTETFTGTFEEAARFAREMNNDARRHSTEPERAIAAAKLAQLLKEESERRMRAGTPAPDGARVGKSAELAAEITGASARQVERVTRVLEHGTPELVRAMQDQTITISDAASLATQSERVQNRALDKVREGKAKTLNSAMRQDTNGGQAEDDDGEAAPEIKNAPRVFAKGRDMIQKLSVYMDVCNKTKKNQAKRNQIAEHLNRVFDIFEEWTAVALRVSQREGADA